MIHGEQRWAGGAPVWRMVVVLGGAPPVTFPQRSRGDGVTDGATAPQTRVRAEASDGPPARSATSLTCRR